MMKDRSTKRSLLKLLLLILTTVDQTMLILAIHRDNYPQRVLRRINLPRAVEATKRFLCREPQARSYNLRDLVQNLESSESANQPVYIVLNRCDNHSGCCVSPDLSCAPIQSSIYYEDVQIEIWSLLTNSTRKVWIRIEQHGNCSCEISNHNDRIQENLRLPGIEIL